MDFIYLPKYFSFFRIHDHISPTKKSNKIKYEVLRGEAFPLPRQKDRSNNFIWIKGTVGRGTQINKTIGKRSCRPLRAWAWVT